MKIELRVTVTADDGNQSQSALHVDGVAAEYKAIAQALDGMAERLRRTVIANHVPGWDGVARVRPGN